MPEIDTSNHAKYVEAESSPVLRSLMGHLYATVVKRTRSFAPIDLLDAGCGEGHAVGPLRALGPIRYTGVDANPACIAWCRDRHPELPFAEASVLALPFENAAFDVVVCMEVLEHLDAPAAAVSELARVARRGVVITVPFEPVFQLGNALRGKYPESWGNHPEHIQHWGRRSFPRFLERTRALEDVSVDSAGPWWVACGRPRP